MQSLVIESTAKAMKLEAVDGACRVSCAVCRVSIIHQHSPTGWWGTRCCDATPTRPDGEPRRQDQHFGFWKIPSVRCIQSERSDGKIFKIGFDEIVIRDLVIVIFVIPYSIP